MFHFYRNIRLSIQAFHPIAATLYKNLHQLGTANQNPLLFVGAIMADFSTAKTKPIPQLPNTEIPRLRSSSAPSAPSHDLSELAANTLIGVDICAISTDALTTHPLQLLQEANGYPAKETRKSNLHHLLFRDHYRCSIYQIVYDDPPVFPPMDCHSGCRYIRHVL